MDYAQVSNGILCNGTNTTTLYLQKIPFLSVLWQLYSLTGELSALGKYEEFQLAPGSLYLRPHRKRLMSFLNREMVPRDNLDAAISKAN